METRRVLCVLAVWCLAACGGDEPADDPEPVSEFERRAEELEAEVVEEEAPDFEELGEYSPPEKVGLRPPATFESRSLDPGAMAEDVPAPALEIYVFDLGQADSMLVVGPPPEKRTLLVDLGEDRNRDPRDNYLRVAQRILDVTGEATLDYFVVSHFHDDHVGSRYDGVAGLLDGVEPQFRIETFIDAGDEGSEYMPSRRGTLYKLEQGLERWLDEGKVGTRIQAEVGDHQIDLGSGVRVEILASGGRSGAGDDGALAVVEARYPGRYEYAPASENDLSVALEISCGDFELFTAGDLTGYNADDWNFVPIYTPKSYEGGKKETYTNVESHLVREWQAAGRETDVEVYRGNHHGSQYSTAPELLAALDPEVVVFSTGGGYGHPKATVIERVAQTADQLATTRVASSSQATWEEAGGQIAGEVEIVVDAACESYTIDGEPRRAFTDAEESSGADEG